MPPDRRPSLAGSVSSPTGGHYAADAAPSSLHSNGAGGQEDDHSASPSAEPEGSKGKRKHTRGIGRGRVSFPCPSALCNGANLASPGYQACLTCRKRKVKYVEELRVTSSTVMLTHVTFAGVSKKDRRPFFAKRSMS